MIFPKYQVMFYILDNNKRIILKNRRNLLFEKVLLETLNIHDYLHKYTTDARVYFEELNEYYRTDKVFLSNSVPLGAFIPEGQLRGGSKKYISRRKYKRTSTKTKRIRKLI
jgi:hypothetical protein